VRAQGARGVTAVFWRGFNDSGSDCAAVALMRQHIERAEREEASAVVRAIANLDAAQEGGRGPWIVGPAASQRGGIL
jgi:hypothetical protein